MSLRALSTTAPAGEAEELSWREAYVVRWMFCMMFVQAGGSCAAVFYPFTQPWLNAFSDVIAKQDLPWVQHWVIAEFIVATVAATLWTAVERRRWNRELYQCALLIARIILVSTMFHFGLWKVFPTWGGPPAQLWHPTPADLISPLGQFPAWEIFWGWTGVAPTYVMFTWVVEIGAAVLMFFQRTVLLGTLLNTASLLNIGIMITGFNSSPGSSAASFWTPGRRGFAVAIILYDQWPRIRGYLFDDAPVVPAFRPLRWPNQVFRYSVAVLLVWGFIRGMDVGSIWGHFAAWSNQRTRWDTDAVYSVDQFTVNGRVASTDSAGNRWRLVGILGCTATARTIDDRKVQVALISSPGDDPHCVPVKRTWGFANQATARYGTFEYADTARYQRISQNELRLVARVGTDTIEARIARIPDDEIALWDPNFFWNLHAGRIFNSIVAMPEHRR